MGQTIHVDGRQERLQLVKDLVAKHFPGGGAPNGLLIDMYKALGRAETKGFGECLEFFQQSSFPANDERGAG